VTDEKDAAQREKGSGDADSCFHSRMSPSDATQSSTAVANAHPAARNRRRAACTPYACDPPSTGKKAKRWSSRAKVKYRYTSGKCLPESGRSTWVNLRRQRIGRSRNVFADCPMVHPGCIVAGPGHTSRVTRSSEPMRRSKKSPLSAGF
jgi:hypothetical protein